MVILVPSKSEDQAEVLKSEEEMARQNKADIVDILWFCGLPMEWIQSWRQKGREPRNSMDQWRNSSWRQKGREPSGPAFAKSKKQ